MTDILDEKPNRSGNLRDGRLVYYEADEMDAWLEKVSPLVELAEQVIATFNEDLPPEKVIDFYKARQSMVKRYGKIDDLIEDSKKLEAIETKFKEWNQNYPNKYIMLDALGKILEGE